MQEGKIVLGQGGQFQAFLKVYIGGKCPYPANYEVSMDGDDTTCIGTLCVHTSEDWDRLMERGGMSISGAVWQKDKGIWDTEALLAPF